MSRIKNWASIPPLRLLVPIMATLGLYLTAWALAHPVEIHVDGQVTSVRTHARTVEGALRQVGQAPRQADEVFPSLSQPLKGVRRIEMRRAQPVLVTFDGESGWVNSASLWPANLLQQMDVRLLPGDRLWIDGMPYHPDQGQLKEIPDRLRLVRGSSVSIRRSGQPIQIQTAAATAAEALADKGHALYEGDIFEPAAVSAPERGQAVAWRPSQPVRAMIAGEGLWARTAAETVGEALQQMGITLLGLDFVQPGLESDIPEDDPIWVTRVREEVLVELEPVPFETEYQPLSELELDSKRVIETGSYGVRADQVRVRYENGEEVQRSVEGNWLAREPDPRVIGYGTDIVVRTTSTADGTIEYWRAVEMWATSYSPSRAGVPDDYEYFGITASGKPLKKGLVAIDRSLIPFGTQMYVPGYGFAEAADTGGGVKGLWIDLGYEDDNWESWAQYVTVYFLTPVPPASSINYILP
ncbi:MAG: ubiquitin-like domain-containing protein [Anaerolineales bacterium]